MSPRAYLVFVPLLGSAAVTSSVQAAPLASASAQMNADAKWRHPLTGAPAALHVLNRLAFGPRPGDVALVQKMGVKTWIEGQLQPNSLDDASVETKLAGLAYLHADPTRLSLIYRGDNGAIRKFLQMQGGKKKARLEEVQAQTATTPDMTMAQGDVAATKGKASRLNRILNDRQKQTLQEFQAAGLPLGVSVMTAGQLVQAKLVRAVESKRQLQEVLADFWSNHFNIDMRKNADRTLKVLDDRDTIRPHLFGSFRELLGASAHSPAMLVYLDNARSTKAMPAMNGKTKGGLNENYGRELMELHTLGVDGGYTQTDVTEVARCFTGWSLDNDGSAFKFRARAHDDGEKHVLGHIIQAGGGQGDGEEVLDILASSPQTARFLSRELCQRFVADEPPAALVDRVAATWTQSKGDLPSVYRALFLSPEFLSQGAYRAKIKSPFEYTVSAVRALGGELSVPDTSSRLETLRLLQIGTPSSYQDAKAAKRKKENARPPLAAEIANLGQPVFACQPPTGWSEDSSAWVSAGAIVGRLNFALALTAGSVGDVRFNADTFRASSLDELANQLVGGQLSDATRSTLAKATASDPTDGAKMRALILGSPEFQRR